MPSPQEPFWRQTFDPQSKFIIFLNHFLLLIGVLNVGNDVFFFYLPKIDEDTINIDFGLASLVSTVRMVGDSCQFLGIIVKFRTSFEEPGNGVFRKSTLVNDPKVIAQKYLKSTFCLDFLAALPILQVYLWYNLPALQTLSKSHRRIIHFLSRLTAIFSIQIFPRMYILNPLKKKILEKGSSFMMPSWTGAFECLLLYIMLSQFLGAEYYLLYILYLLDCKIVCENKAATAISAWDELLRDCGMDDQIEKGMLSDIYRNKVGSRSFLQRYMYCFSWGLKSLSSMGQNFQTNASVMETSFSFLVTIFGLLLFAGSIAHMQTSIQSMDPGEEQQMVWQREVEEWASIHHIPPDMKRLLQQTVVSHWRTLRGLDDEKVLGLLPLDLQCHIRRYLYFDLACNLPFFAKMDHELAHFFYGHLRTFSCSKDTFVLLEGEPVRHMLLIFSGQLEISSINGGPSSSTFLGAGALCGSELLAWASLPSASFQNHPSSSQSVKCLTDVEAFSLSAEDLKLLGIQFNCHQKFQQALK